jgi:hypothetical protein
MRQLTHWFALRVGTIFSTSAFLGACSASPEQPEEFGTESARLYGPVFFDAYSNVGQGSGPCAGSGVTDPLSQSEIDAVQFILGLVVSRSRAAATSPALAQCLDDVMLTGGINYPWGNDGGAFGPYCRPSVDANCAGNTGDGKDPYNDTALVNLGLADARASQGMRLFNEGQAWFPTTLYCDNEQPVGACGATPASGSESQTGTSRLDDHKVLIGRAHVETMLGNFSCAAEDPPYSAFLPAQVIWHEGLHVHGYDHKAWPFDASIERRQAPLMYNSCLFRVLQTTDGVGGAPPPPASCNSLTCASGYHKLLRNHVHDAVVGTGCHCVRDPSSGASRVDTTLSGTGQIAIDSRGRIFRRSGINVFRLDGTAWTTVYTNSDPPESILAGGDRLFVVNANTVYRSDRNQTAFTSLGAAGTISQLAVDDFGTVYRRNTFGSVSRCRLAQTAFTNLASINASQLRAGGDQVFAIEQTTNALRRYDPFTATWNTIGGAGSGFAVDATGNIYGILPDQSSIYRYSLKTNQWQQLSSPAATLTGIIGGRRVLVRSSTNQVHELNPQGSWSLVASSWTNWAARGPNVAVSVGATWHAFTDYAL